MKKKARPRGGRKPVLASARLAMLKAMVGHLRQQASPLLVFSGAGL